MAGRGCYPVLVMEKLGGNGKNQELREIIEHVVLKKELDDAIKEFGKSQPKKRAK